MNENSHSGQSRWDRPAFLAGALYLAVLLLLFHRLMFGDVLRPGAVLHGSAPFLSRNSPDATRHVNRMQFDVWRMLACCEQYQYDAAQTGRFPTWNPHIYCGFAFHGNGQSAMLNPFHWPYFFIEPNFARGPLAIARLWIGGFATFLLVRRLGIGGGGGFVSGLVWMLASFNIRWLLWPLASSTLWLPVVLLALDAFLVSPGRRTFAFGVLSATILQLAGHPETQFLAGVVAGLYTLSRTASLGLGFKQSFGRLVGSLMIMVGGTAGAAASLLPFALLLPGSTDWIDAIHKSPELLPARGLLLLLAPDHFGRARCDFEYHGPVNYNEAALWFGTLPLAMMLGTVVWCVFHCRKGVRNLFVPAFATALFVGAMLVVFDVWPVSELVHHLPLFAKTNNLRLVFAVQFAGALAAGFVYDAVIVRRDKLLSWSTVAFALAGVLILGWLCIRFHLEPARQALGQYDLEILLHHRSVRMLGGLFVAMLSLAALVLAVARPRQTFPRNAVFATLLLDLLWGAWDLNPIAPENISDPAAPSLLSETIRSTGTGRLVGVDEVLIPNLAMRYGFRDIRGYDFPLPRRLPPLLERLGIDYNWTIIPSALVFPQMSDELSAYLDRTGVRYLYSYVRQPALSRRSGEDDSHHNWPLISGNVPIDSIYYNPNAYPRVWFAERFDVVDKEQALEALLDPAHDLRQHSVIESQQDLVVEPVHPMAVGEVTIESDAGEQVVLRTQSSTGGLVVLSDRMEPGWTVTIDGHPASALQANYLFRGVIVPAGEHTVTWTYHSPGLFVGSVVSLLTLCFMAVLLICPSKVRGGVVVRFIAYVCALITNQR